MQPPQEEAVKSEEHAGRNKQALLEQLLTKAGIARETKSSIPTLQGPEREAGDFPYVYTLSPIPDNIYFKASFLSSYVQMLIETFGVEN